MALKRGRQEGRQEALCEGLRGGIEIALRVKFGAADKRLWKEIQSLKQVSQLQEVMQLIEKSATAEELRKLIRG